MMRQPGATRIGAFFAIAAVAAGLVFASAPASAQGYFVDGRAASVAEALYLASQGMRPGNWRISGWGIGPADRGTIMKTASADAGDGKCWYVLDVPLGDCGAADKAIAERAPDPGSSLHASSRVQLAAVEAGGQ